MNIQTLPESEAIIVNNLGLARKQARIIANRLTSEHTADDLFGAGCVGLIEGARDYANSGAGVELENFLGRRIYLAIMDYVRDNDFTSKDTRHRANITERTRRAMALELQTEPTDEQVAQAQGCRIDTVRRHRALLNTVNESMSGTEGRRCMDIASDVDVHADLEKKQMLERMEAAMTSLNERDRALVHAHYIREMSLRAMEAEFGMSYSAISRAVAGAVERMRTIMLGGAEHRKAA